ncbi:MAG: alkaline phosphatase family protein [Acidobacteria bacterium]|nr:MAG: alkaline phosphatase family protein [Acidobacteriota bacterium]REK07263.1 MAG: alkaline phosphatase family protein [Acidobacteriota bacterium]
MVPHPQADRPATQPPPAGSPARLRRRLARPALPHCVAPVLGLVILGLVAACARPEPEPQTEAPAPPPEGTPRLVLLVTVDQFYGGYVERFRPLFRSGLSRLLDEGVWFAEAHHEHATTSTAPGHATLATGAHPGTHGVVGNSWYERSESAEVYCCDDSEFGRAPRRLLSPTLGDLLKERWPQAKVFAVAGKDRASILTAGHHADGAFWYDSNTGGFTTSDYYPAPGAKRPWLEEFHRRDLVGGLFGTAWTPSIPLEEMAAYGVEPLDFGLFPRQFPRAFGGLSMRPDRSFYASVYGTPMADWAVVQMAKAMVAGEALGTDAYPDLLSVGLSALDAAGHGYGPDSPEMLDTLLRVDRVLGELLDFLDQQVGREHVVVSLSSDHGVGTVPELLLAAGEDAGRFGAEQVLCVQQLGLELGRTFGIAEIDWMPEMGYLDREALEARQVDYAGLRDAVAEGLTACDRIDAVYTREEIEAATTPRLRLYRNSFHPERSPDLIVDLTPNTLTSSTVASHGSPNRYDTWVPWLLAAPSLPAQRVDLPVATVDVAPTLSGLLGLPMRADGIDRGELLASGAASSAPAAASATPDP